MKPLKYHNRLLSLILATTLLINPVSIYAAEIDTISENGIDNITVTENLATENENINAISSEETPVIESEEIPEIDIPEITIPENPVPEITEPVSISEEQIPDTIIPEETVSEEIVPAETVLETISNDQLEAAGNSSEEWQKEKKRQDTAVQNRTREILNGMNDNWPDEIKLMYLHDKVCESATYDWDAAAKRPEGNPRAGSAYGCLIDGKSVCEGYASAFTILANLAGIETVTIGSRANRPGEIGHAWNRTILNGKAYYTDCTWDDVDDNPNLPSCYTHFLNSRTECARLHSDYDPSDWEIGAGSHLIKDSEWTAVDTKYDNAFWNYDENNLTILKNGKIVYRTTDGTTNRIKLKVHDFTKNLPVDGSQDTVIFDAQDKRGVANLYTAGNSVFYEAHTVTYENGNTFFPGKIYGTDSDGRTTVLKETSVPYAIEITGIEGNTLKYATTNQITQAVTYGTIDISSSIPATVKTQSITANCNTEINLDMGLKDTEQLSCTVLPANASNTNIIWKTSDISIADVSLDGKVTATGSGNAIITAETVDGLSVQFNVSVKDRRYIKTITTPYTDTINLHVDDWFNSISPKDPETLQLTWSYTPTDALKKDVSFTSQDTRVAYVDGNGLITARDVGETDIVIYQTDDNGQYTAGTTVHVKVWYYGEGPAEPDPSPNPDPDPDPNSDPDPDPNNPDPDKPKPNQAAYAVVGQKLNARQAFFEDETDIAMYKVTTPEGGSAAKYASIKKSGILTCKKAGDIVITAYEKTGKNSYEAIAEADLEILKKPKLKLPAQMTYEGQEINARACLTEDWDSNGVDIAGWKSSKPSVIEIDENGNLKANHSGTATITAMIRKPGMDHTKNSVNVKAKVSVKIPSFAKTNITMLTGQKLVIGMKNVNGKSNAQWSVSGDLCEITAHTNKKGNPTGKAVLKAIKAGSDGTITCVVDEKTYTCHLTVDEPVMKKTNYKVKAGKKITVRLKQTKLKAKDIEWKSEDESIAIVSKGGTVTGVNTGTVKVYTDAGGVRNECTVEVY